MARARNIKPGFFTNEELVELDFATRLLFIGLWTEADREGRLDDRPKRIKMSLFPADNVDVEVMLGALEGRGFIRRYTVDSLKYIQIVNFSKHQNPHHTERKSVIPPESNGGYQGVNGELTVNPPLSNGEYLADSPNHESLFTDSLKTNSDELVSAPPKKQKRVTQKNLNAHTPDEELNFSSWPNWPSEQVWSDYKKMRSAKRSWLTQTIVDHLGRVITELVKMGYTTDQVLTVATVGNWTGLEVHWVLKNYSVNTHVRSSAHGPPQRIGAGTLGFTPEDYQRGIAPDGSF